MARRRRVVLALLVACYALLSVAWVMGNPPGSAPDEGDHYLRALAVASGDLRGRPNPELEGQPETLPKEAGEPELAALWLKKGARVVTVPPGLAPVSWGCNAFDSTRDASCLLGHVAPGAATDRTTTMGTVEPGLYLLPGLAARLGGTPATAVRLGRLANAAVAVGLLGVAATMLWSPSRSPLALVGLVVAVTPMVVFVGSTIATSGLEIAASTCFFAALLRLGREGGGRGAWAAAGVAGVVLAASRSLGPVWILAMVAVVLVADGWRACGRALRTGGAPAAIAIAAIAAAALSTALWELAFQPGVDVDGAYFWDQLSATYGDLPGVARDLVGHFGWLDTTMPALAYLTWAAMALALVAVALVVGAGRQRVALCAVPVVATVATLVISAGLLRQNGFRVQGRHVLAFVVVLPLLAADVVASNPGRLRPLRPAWWLPGFATAALAVHAVGWYANARRSAVGANGPIWFLGLSKWSPPGTWALSCAVVALAVVAGLAGAWLAARSGPHEPVYASGP